MKNNIKTIEDIIEILENNDIQIYKYVEEEKLCGYELNTYTNGGVNMIIFLDFRDSTLNPENPIDFINVWNEYFEGFDIDDEVLIHRQDEYYVRAFSLTESINDFRDWVINFENIFNDELPKLTEIVKPSLIKSKKIKKLDRDERQEIGITITNELIKLGYVPDCTDTNNESEFEVQDVIAKVIKKLKLYKKL